MEFLILYFFVMVEKFGALLMLGWAAFWGGLVVTAFVAFGCAINTESARYDGTPAVTFSDNFENKNVKVFRKIAKWFAIVGLILGCLSYLIPSQKDLAIIVGGGLTYQAVTSETGKRIGGKAIGLLEQKIDSVLADTPDVKPQTKAPEKQAL